MSYQDKRVRKKRRWGKTIEYTSYERALPVGEEYDNLLKELKGDFSKRKKLIITPQELAVRKDIRVSVAKKLIKDLVEQGVLKEEMSSRRLKVYSIP